MNKKLLRALNDLARHYEQQMDTATRLGKVTVEERMGVAVATMMRHVDRITELPEDRDLTDTEVMELQASLLSIQVASTFLLDELPFPAMAATVAAFDMSKTN